MRSEARLLPPADDSATVDPAAGPGGSAADAAVATPLAETHAVAHAQPGLHWWIIGLVIVLDQITKAIVRSLVPLYDSVTVVAGLVDITHVRNAGVAFGLLNDLDTEFKWVVTT